MEISKLRATHPPPFVPSEDLEVRLEAPAREAGTEDLRDLRERGSEDRSRSSVELAVPSEPLELPGNMATPRSRDQVSAETVDIFFRMNS